MDRPTTQAHMTFADHAEVAAQQRTLSFNVHEALKKVAVRLDPAVVRILTHTFLSHPRKNQSTLTPPERNAFNSAVQASITDGSYGTIAGIHAVMSHNMHGFMNFIGALRFLPWHRVYLYIFEQQLQMYKPGLRIPYWDWANDHALPSWVHLPSGVTRGPDTSFTPPSQADINTTVLNQTGYVNFSEHLEAYHNTVHMYVGGNTMPFPSVSPHDPMFWLHHANVDRIWAEWENNYPTILPPLAGPDAVMDPWPQNITDTQDTDEFFYYYA